MFSKEYSLTPITLTIAYFTAPSKEGRDLFFNVREAVEQSIPSRWKIDWCCINHRDFPEYHQDTLLNRQNLSLTACLQADLVIFDGSIDHTASEDIFHDSVSLKKNGRGICSQYEYAYDLMNKLDYVLIVSRTKLPYNFEGLRKGGAPGWIRIQRMKTQGTYPDAPHSLENDKIRDWIVEIIRDSTLELPRKDKLEYLPSSALQMLNIWKQIVVLKDHSDKRLQDEYKKDIFISFRSTQCMFQMEKPTLSMEHVVTNFVREMLGGDGDFLYYPPGNISKEIMSEQRRWEIVSMIDRQMSKCGGVLIYKSDDYDSSWWTAAEKFSLSNRIHNNKSTKQYLYVVRPSNNRDEIKDVHIEKLDSISRIKGFLPDLSKEQHRRIARRFANSDPYEASYEFDGISPAIKQLSRPLKSLLATFTSTVMWGVQRTEFGKTLFGEDTDRLSDLNMGAKESMESYTWGEDFQKGLICDCKHCREAYEQEHPEEKQISVDNFLNLDKPYTRRFTAQDYQNCLDYFAANPSGHFALNLSCGHRAFIRKDGQYYRFLQPRMGRVVNQEGLLIKTIPSLMLEFD